MERFDYFFGVELGRKSLSMVDNLSRALQLSTISACQGQEVVRKTINTLQSVRSDESFDCFGSTLKRGPLKLNYPPLLYLDVNEHHADLK